MPSVAGLPSGGAGGVCGSWGGREAGRGLPPGLHGTKILGCEPKSEGRRQI